MGLVTQRNEKLEKLFNDLAIDPKEKAKKEAEKSPQNNDQAKSTKEN